MSGDVLTGGSAPYPKSAEEVSGKPAGSVMTVDIELNGQRFQLLNGGPHFTPDEAISFVLQCDTQDETALEGARRGRRRAWACGWLKDRFGVSWQVVPSGLDDLVGMQGTEQYERAMAAMLQMGKLDIAELQRAAERATADTR